MEIQRILLAIKHLVPSENPKLLAYGADSPRKAISAYTIFDNGFNLVNGSSTFRHGWTFIQIQKMVDTMWDEDEMPGMVPIKVILKIRN